MTDAVREHLAEFIKDGVTWTLHDTAKPGACKLADWCGGECEDPEPDSLGETHGREIAVATVRGERVLTVDVGQWKAHPDKPYRDGGTIMWKNTDQRPYVFLATWRERRLGLSLEPSQALVLAHALRVTECLPFADVVLEAVAFADRVAEQRKAVRC